MINQKTTSRVLILTVGLFVATVSCFCVFLLSVTDKIFHIIIARQISNFLESLIYVYIYMYLSFINFLSFRNFWCSLDLSHMLYWKDWFLFFICHSIGRLYFAVFHLIYHDFMTWAKMVGIYWWRITALTFFYRNSMIDNQFLMKGKEAWIHICFPWYSL